MVDLFLKHFIKNVLIGAAIAGVQIYFVHKAEPKNEKPANEPEPATPVAEEPAPVTEPTPTEATPTDAEEPHLLPSGHVVLEPDHVEFRLIDPVLAQSAQKAGTKTGRRKSKRPPRLIDELDQLDELPQREKTSTARTRNRQQ